VVDDQRLEQKLKRDPWKCPYCRVNLILEPQTYAYICPICGTVYDYEMNPSYVQLQHVAPFEPKQTTHYLDMEVIERAAKRFGEGVAKEIKKLKQEKAEEVLKALEYLVAKRKYKISWEALRKAVEIARKYDLKVDLDALREQKIRDEIEEIIKREELPITVDEVYEFAVRYKKIWSGRKASTIATIFTYIYAKRKLGIEIKVKPRIRKLIKIVETLISEREVE